MSVKAQPCGPREHRPRNRMDTASGASLVLVAPRGDRYLRVSVKSSLQGARGSVSDRRSGGSLHPLAVPNLLLKEISIHFIRGFPKTKQRFGYLNDRL